MYSFGNLESVGFRSWSSARVKAKRELPRNLFFFAHALTGKELPPWSLSFRFLSDVEVGYVGRMRLGECCGSEVGLELTGLRLQARNSTRRSLLRSYWA